MQRATLGGKEGLNRTDINNEAWFSSTSVEKDYQYISITEWNTAKPRDPIWCIRREQKDEARKTKLRSLWNPVLLKQQKTNVEDFPDSFLRISWHIVLLLCIVKRAINYTFNMCTFVFRKQKKLWSVMNAGSVWCECSEITEISQIDLFVSYFTWVFFPLSIISKRQIVVCQFHGHAALVIGGNRYIWDVNSVRRLE